MDAISNAPPSSVSGGQAAIFNRRHPSRLPFRHGERLGKLGLRPGPSAAPVPVVPAPEPLVISSLQDLRFCVAEADSDRAAVLRLRKELSLHESVRQDPSFDSLEKKETSWASLACCTWATP